MRAGVLALLVAVTAAGCRINVTLSDIDRMHDEVGARTVLHEERLTLWSPLDAVTSRAWADLLARELLAVESAFDPARLAPERLQVVLERVAMPHIPVGDPNEEPTILIYPDASRHGVRGHATADIVTIFLAPANSYRLGDRPPLVHEADPESLIEVVRHELGHVATRRAGLELATWLSEGSADVVESLVERAGELVDEGLPADALESALALDRDSRRLEPMLAWVEHGERVMRGTDPVDLPRRLLCGLYVRWLLGLTGDGRPVRDLAARIEQLAARPRAELLAGEGAWLAWLEAVTAAP